jgi:hypothetical protein
LSKRLTVEQKERPVSDETGRTVCPQFHSALVEWYDVQGYCVPRRSSDRPAIPETGRFASFCATSQFKACPWFSGVRNYAVDAPLGVPRAERA